MDSLREIISKTVKMNYDLQEGLTDSFKPLFKTGLEDLPEYKSKWDEIGRYIDEYLKIQRDEDSQKKYY